MKKLLLLIAFTAGCATLGDDVKNASAPTLVIAASAAPPSEMPAETKPASPGPGHLWVAGYYDYLNGRHVWRPGRWVPCKPGYDYVRAHWEQTPQGWTLHVPHWQLRHAPAGTDTRLARQ